MSEIMKMFDELIKSITIIKKQVEEDPLNTELQQGFIEIIKLFFSDEMIEMAKILSLMLDYYQIDKEDEK